MERGMAGGLTLVHGQAVDAQGHPVAGARVGWAAGPGSVPDVMLLTDAQGRFTLTAPVVGTYTLRCISDDAGGASLQVRAAGQPLQVQLRLQR